MPNISLTNIFKNLSDNTAEDINLTDFYRGDDLVANTAANSEVPTSGEISLSDLDHLDSSITWAYTGATSFTFRQNESFDIPLSPNPRGVMAGSDADLSYTQNIPASIRSGISNIASQARLGFSGSITAVGTYTLTYTAYLTDQPTTRKTITITITIIRGDISYDGLTKAWLSGYSRDRLSNVLPYAIWYPVFLPEELMGGVPPYTIIAHYGQRSVHANDRTTLYNSRITIGGTTYTRYYGIQAESPTPFVAENRTTDFRFRVTDSAGNVKTITLTLNRSTANFPTTYPSSPSSGVSSTYHAGTFTVTIT